MTGLLILLLGWAPPPSFQRDVVPIFQEHCLACHNTKTPKGAFDLSSYEKLMKPGRSGPALIRGAPQESLLIKMMLGHVEPSMPKGSDLLEPGTVSLIEQWIKAGARFDGTNPKEPIQPKSKHLDRPRFSTRSQPIPITALAFHPRKPILAAGLNNGVSFFDVRQKLVAGIQNYPMTRTYSLSFSPDGKRLLAAGGEPGRNGSVFLLDLDGNKPPSILTTAGDTFFDAEFSSDGHWIAVGGADRIVTLWDAQTGKKKAHSEHHSDAILDLAIHPKEPWIATASRDKHVKVWNYITGEVEAVMDDHATAVYGVVFSRDGQHGWSVSQEGMLRLWTIKDGKERRAIQTGSEATRIILDRNSERMVALNGGGRISLYHDDGRLVKRIETGESWLYSLALGPSGEWAVGSESGDVLLFSSGLSEKPVRWQPWFPSPDKIHR